MIIHGYNKLTLLDYPGRIAATVFSGGCNFRCPFCHNSSLVLSPASVPVIPEETVFEHLRLRKNSLEGICITGGEPTLDPDLIPFIRKLKALGLKVKLDTNGTAPKVLDALLSGNLVDHIAMDIKASPDNYAHATGLDSLSLDNIFDSVSLIMKKAPAYEFRTTVVDGIHTENDFVKIGRWIKGASAYYLQCYKTSGEIISPLGLSSPSKETLLGYREILLKDVPNTQLRGID